jgi:pantetheine-phosphate adenylyltransferase|tara:strand:+ start:1818 stop:2279 length:462 start_codon:yes stop_codon:yes gene_type:complete
MEFNLVALGGTFDIVHIGHIALLEKGFSISKKVIIGLTSDQFAKRKGKTLVHDFQKRVSILESVIREKFPDSEFEIAKLENDFGPAVIEGYVEALVVSDETSSKGELLNKLRLEKNNSPVTIISVPMILAKDGKRISTTRIRNSEIDTQGNIC